MTFREDMCDLLLRIFKFLSTQMKHVNISQAFDELLRSFYIKTIRRFGYKMMFNAKEVLLSFL